MLCLLGRQQESSHERCLSDEEAHALLESNRIAADSLAAAARESPAKLNQTAESAAVEVLMVGQRQAAAILLEARMRVTGGRASAAE